MKKNNVLITCIALLTGLLAACEKDTAVTDPYANWEIRNEAYLDSIVRVARKALVNPQSGETWRIYKDFSLIPADPTLIRYTKHDSVYVKLLNAADSLEWRTTPLVSDSVQVFYQGYLMNGTRFDGNYKGVLNTTIHTPATFALNRVVNGWTSAFIHMKEGMSAELYIPYQLAYGKEEQSSIPGYSVLKFNVYLEKVIHPKHK